MVRRLVALPYILAVVFAGFAAFVISYFADYGHWFIHPHQFEIHLPRLLAGGPQISLRSFLNIFQQFDPTESRPRFLAYAIIWANLHMRMWLYEWFVLYPPFSIGWILEALVGPFLFFRLVRNMSGDRAAAWIALIVYITSIGFLSGFAMPLMPSKPLTNVVFIATLWLLSEAKLRATPGQMFHEVPGARWLMRALGGVLLAGLFLDEVPFFAFLLPFLFYPELFFPSSLSQVQIRRTAETWLPLAIPPVLFLLLVVVVAPVISQKMFGYRFDYIGSVFVNREAAETGKTFLSGKMYGFGLESLVSNFVSLTASALVPWQAAPLVAHPSGGGVVTGMTVNLASVLAAVVALGGAAVIGILGRERLHSYLLRSLGALVLFILFMSVLSGRHVPFITGYVYACSLAVFLAMIAGLAFASVSGGAAKVAAIGVALWMGGVQLTNFDAINKNWITVHNEGWVKREYEKSLPIARDGRATTRRELRDIWTAWKKGDLEGYLKSSPISSGAVFLVFELRYLDKWRAARR